jgi:NAD(P)-dependent dehydrogenase (short-subunit alcohol dehydrogenase family)
MKTNHKTLHGIRVALTGGTSGLGLALLDELLARGARVAFIARHQQRVAEVAAARSRVAGIVGDIANKEDIYPLAMQINGLLGGVDVLVNNASALGPVPLALLADTECEDFETALATNLLGPFRLTRAVLGSLSAAARERGGAVVLNVSSDAAIEPYPTWGAYGASKAALRHLSRIWDKELAARRVRVLSLDPGDMDAEAPCRSSP